MSSSSQTPRGAPSQGIITNGYTPEQGIQLGITAFTATFLQLVCAFDYIVKLLGDNGIGYAGMGGLALRFRGSRRDTHDVDVAAACDMHTLRQICKGQSRLKMPLGPTASVMRVFIEVGPKHGETVDEGWVQADMILPGSLGAPDTLEGNRDTITVPTPLGTRQYQVLNIRCQMRSKLGSFFVRNTASDLADLLFMCASFGPRIAQFRNQLDQAQREHFVTRAAQSPAHDNMVKKIKYILGVP